MRPVLVLACVLALLAAASARAGIVVGGIDVPVGQTHPISQFTSVAQGAMAPYRQIAGPDTQVREPYFGVYEPNQQLIYISDFRGKAVRVFSAFASGNVAPLRVLDSPFIASTRANAPVFSHNELGVIVSACCIDTYALHASGDAVMPVRRLHWGGAHGSSTELHNPNSLIYLPALDMYAVLDSERDPPYARRIVFHHRTSRDYAAPSNRITGPNLQGAVGMAYDPDTRRIFVLRSVPQATFPSVTYGVISVFSDVATGDAVPMHTITSTDLYVDGAKYFVGVGFDPYTNRLMVSSTQPGMPASNRVVALSATATGATPAIQILNGTHLSANQVGIPFGMPQFPTTQASLIAIAHPTTFAYGQNSALSSHGGLGNGAVDFAVTQGAASCRLWASRTSVAAIAPGSCTITVTKAASTIFPAQTATIELIVTRAAQAPLILAATPDQITVGGTSTLSASGGSGDGALYFQILEGAANCTISGQIVTGIAPGTCSVYAYKEGDANYNVIGSQEVFVTVVQTQAVFADGFEAAPQ